MPGYLEAAILSNAKLLAHNLGRDSSSLVIVTGLSMDDEDPDYIYAAVITMSGIGAGFEILIRGPGCSGGLRALSALDDLLKAKVGALLEHKESLIVVERSGSEA